MSGEEAAVLEDDFFGARIPRRYGRQLGDGEPGAPHVGPPPGDGGGMRAPASEEDLDALRAGPVGPGALDAVRVDRPGREDPADGDGVAARSVLAGDWAGDGFLRCFPGFGRAAEQ